MLFQFMPRLADEEYAALESSIKEHGIQVPVILDENGSVIDGHHRKEIAERLGIDYPKRTKVGLSDTDKRTLALTLNIDRRHLSQQQKRRLVEESIKADPDLSDRAHAKRTGVSPTTVGAVREQVSNLDTSMRVDPETGEVLEAEPAPPARVTGLDGKTYKRPEPSRASTTAAAPHTPSIPTPAEPAPVSAEVLNAETAAKALGRALMTLAAMESPEHRQRIIAEWWPLGSDAVPPDSRALFEPYALRDISMWLMRLASDLEASA